MTNDSHDKTFFEAIRDCGVTIERHESEPPFYIVASGNQKSLKLTSAELLNYRSFRGRVFERWNLLLPPVKQGDWEIVLNKLLPGIKIETDYEGISIAGEVLDLLQMWVKRLHPQLCRHTFATNYLINGGDVFSLEQILGHTTLEMVRRYVTLASAHVTIQPRKFSPMDRMSLTNVEISRSLSE